jgi:glycosyltransferase involved in cell wall biosynthesis
MRKVSVIICTYNSEDTLERLLDSIDSQEGMGVDYTIERIIVDDCSTDHTQQLLRDRGLEYISTPQNTGGPNAGRNIGLSLATGDSICIADHDDAWHPDRLRRMVPLLDKAPIVTSGYIAVDTQTNRHLRRVTQCPHEHKFIVYPENATFLTKLTKKHTGQNTFLGSILFSNTFQENRFEQIYGMVDFDWVLRLFFGQRSVEVCDALYTRYVGTRNLSLNEGYRLNDFAHSIESIQQYAHAFPKDVRIAYRKIHGTMARYYYMTENMKEARRYFRRAPFTLKTVLYYLTTFVGAKLVNRNFPVFK